MYLSNSSWMATFYYENSSLAKDDGIIDLRFDLVWLVLESNNNSQISIIHVYNWDDPLIVIQAIQIEDIGAIQYEVIRCKTFVEKTLLTTLYYYNSNIEPNTVMTNVGADVLGSGTVGLFNLPLKVYAIYIHNPETYPQVPDLNSVLVRCQVNLLDPLRILAAIRGPRNWEDDLSFYSKTFVTASYDSSYGDMAPVGDVVNSITNSYYEQYTSKDGLYSQNYELSSVTETTYSSGSKLQEGLVIKRNIDQIDNSVQIKDEETDIITETDTIHNGNLVLRQAITQKTTTFSELTTEESLIEQALASHMTPVESELASLQDLIAECQTNIESASSAIESQFQECTPVLQTLDNPTDPEGVLIRAEIQKVFQDDAALTHFNKFLSETENPSSIKSSEMGDFVAQLDSLQAGLGDILGLTGDYKTAVANLQGLSDNINNNWEIVNNAEFEKEQYSQSWDCLNTATFNNGEIDTVTSKPTSASTVLSSFTKTVIEVGEIVNIALGIYEVVVDIAQLLQEYGITGPKPTSQTEEEAVSSMLDIAQTWINLAAGCFSLFTTAYATIIGVEDVAQFAKVCAWIGFAFSVVIAVIQIINFYNSQPNAPASLIWLNWEGFALSVGIALAVTIIAISIGGGPYGVAAGLIVAGISILFSILQTVWENPHVSIVTANNATTWILPSGYDGSFIAGQTVKLKLTYINDGHTDSPYLFWALEPTQVVLSVRLGIGTSAGTYTYGQWVVGQQVSEGVTAPAITAAVQIPTSWQAADLYYDIQMEVQIWYTQWYLFAPDFDGYQATSTDQYGDFASTLKSSAAVLPAAVSGINSNSMPFPISNPAVLEQNYASERSQYKWLDAYNTAFTIEQIGFSKLNGTLIREGINDALSVPIFENINLQENYFINPNQQITVNLQPQLRGSFSSTHVRMTISSVPYIESADPETWSIIMSPSGIHPLSNSVSLTIAPPNNPVLAYGVRLFRVEIDLTNGVLIYAGNISVTVNRVRNININLGSNNISIVPGNTYNGITVQNLGNGNETLGYGILVNSNGNQKNLSTWSSNPDWVVFPPNVKLQPGESSTPGQILICPPRSYLTKAGTYEFIMNAFDYDYYLANHGTELSYAFANGTITIEPFHEVTTSVKPIFTSVYPGGSATYSFSVRNLGNVADQYRVVFNPVDFGTAFLAYPTAIQESWASFNNTAFRWDNSIGGWDGTLALNPGQNVTTTLSITVPKDWTGFENATYELDMAATLETNSSISNAISSTMVVLSTLGSMENYIVRGIGQLNEAVQSSPDSSWTHPASWLKEAMEDELDCLTSLISYIATNAAYDLLLYDIKPKLTGLETFENETAWGCGRYREPWVVNSALQTEFKIEIDPLLHDIKVFANLAISSDLNEIAGLVSVLMIQISANLHGRQLDTLKGLVNRATKLITAMINGNLKGIAPNQSSIDELSFYIGKIDHLARNSAINSTCTKINAFIDDLSIRSFSWSWYPWWSSYYNANTHHDHHAHGGDDEGCGDSGTACPWEYWGPTGWWSFMNGSHHCGGFYRWEFWDFCGFWEC